MMKYNELNIGELYVLDPNKFYQCVDIQRGIKFHEDEDVIVKLTNLTYNNSTCFGKLCTKIFNKYNESVGELQFSIHDILKEINNDNHGLNFAEIIHESKK